MKMRFTILVSRALALFAILALTVVPACAPLCAGLDCGHSKTAAAEDSCHSASVSPQQTPHFHAISRCNLQELPVAALRGGNAGLNLDGALQHAIALDYDSADQKTSSAAPTYFDSSPRVASSLLGRFASARNEILRI